MRVLADFLQDLRLTFRSLVRTPVFTATVVVTLAAAIAGNATIFSIVEAALLRPSPFPDSDRLVSIRSIKTPAGQSSFSRVSPADARDWSEEAGTLQIAAFSGNGMTLRENDQVETIYSARITEKFFEVLGVRPLVGRTFETGEWSTAGPPAVVLSYRLWLRRFGADPSVVGKRLKTGEMIVGIMPESFNFPAGAEAWNPIYRDTPEMNRRATRYLDAVGRFRAGQSLQSAKAEMQAICARLAAAYPKDDTGWGVDVLPLRESLVRNFRPALLMLMGAVGFLLVIACANVGGLMLARATQRHKEVTVRLAIGATTGRLIRLFLLEGLTLSALGAAAGIALAAISIDAFFHLLSKTSWTALTAIRGDVHINASVVAFTVTISAIIGLLFGILPTAGLPRKSIASSLHGVAVTARSAGESRSHQLLVIVEFAGAVLLLAGAGLLVESFMRMERVDYGYDPRGLAIMPVPQPRQNARPFQDQLLERIKGLPGVRSAAFMSFNSFGGLNFPFNIEGEPLPDGDAPVRYSAVSADYFRVLKARMLRGREFNDLDSANAPGVAIINDTLAKRYFPAQDPIGKNIAIAYLNRRVIREIIGVVADIRQDAPQEPVKPEVFVHWPQLPWLSAVLVMRTDGSPFAAGNAIQQIIASFDKTLPLYQAQPVESMLGDQIAEPRLYLVVLGVFAAVAVVLAMLGVYGMLSTIATRRRHDMAVRIAIGASAADVVRLVVGEGMRLSAIGMAAGLISAAVLTRVLKNLLFGVTPTDPWTFFSVALLLASAAFLASYIPARRASRVDPTIALRGQ